MRTINLPRPSRPAGFTLIELLVVIAIIAILASILFPVFARARENARRSSCQSNLKQQSLAVIQYTQDFDEKMPLYLVSNATPPDGRCWDTFPTTETPVSPPCDIYWPQVIYPYHKSVDVFFCPNSGRNANVALIGNYGGNIGTNGTNGAFSANAGAIRHMSSFTSASQTYLAMDSGSIAITTNHATAPPLGTSPTPPYYVPGAGSTSAARQGLCDGYYSAVYPGLTAAQKSQIDKARLDCRVGRHFTGVSIAFVDGHAKWLSTDKVVAQAAYTNQPPTCTTDCTFYAGGAFDYRNIH